LLPRQKPTQTALMAASTCGSYGTRHSGKSSRRPKSRPVRTRYASVRAFWLTCLFFSVFAAYSLWSTSGSAELQASNDGILTSRELGTLASEDEEVG